MDEGFAPGAVALASILIVALAVGGTAGATTGIVPQTDGVDPDGVVLRADVAENGSASWTVEYRIRLDDANVTAAFDDLQADVRSNRSAYVDRFERRMAGTVAAAENATGREMRLANVTVTAERRQLPQSYGVVSYRFEWHGFAAVDGERLLIGDALGGLFLDAESRLVISWPEGYEATSISPDGYEERDRSVVWSGPVDFGPDQPRVVVRPAGGFPTGAVAAGVLALLGVAGAVVLYRRRVRAASDAGTGAGAGAAGGATGAEGAAEEPPEELLSPEERVLRFVRERGGRVKQQEVVSEFDWTAARTSQVVGNLREDDRIETFRLGRENVLTLPDTDVVGDGEKGAEEGADEEQEGVDWRPEE
ncbi:MAG: helix-turn-helix transcriptional regulator [Haloferacaceae archaeon]